MRPSWLGRSILSDSLEHSPSSRRLRALPGSTVTAGRSTGCARAPLSQRGFRVELHLPYAASILEIIFINIVLSGDNAVVIALVAHKLPPRQRRQALFWGSGLAVVMRVVLTLLVVPLLQVPGLRMVGGILLAWIACKLLQEEAHPAAT